MGTNTLVGLHIQKCAGTSILEYALSNLPRDVIYQNTSIIRNWEEGRPEFMEIDNYSLLRFVWGHYIHEEMLKSLESPILFTGLRPPMDRLKSLLNYKMRLIKAQGREPLNIQKWQDRQRNPLCRFIIDHFPTMADKEGPGTPFEKAQKVLESFHFVYFTDNFELYASQICKLLGVKYTAIEKGVSPDKGIDIQVDEEKIADDLKLYDWARNRFSDINIESAIESKSGALEKFLSRPLNTDALGDFLYNAQYNEYKNWGKLDSVIEAKEKLAQSLRSELFYYKKNINYEGEKSVQKVRNKKAGIGFWRKFS